MSVGESLQDPARLRSASSGWTYPVVAVPQHAMWFVDAARRPMTGQPVAHSVDLDRRSLSVAVRPAVSATVPSVSRWAKRLFDIAFAATLLVVLFPMLVVVALIVTLTSSGGPFFVQQRVGLNGRSFSMLKFRSMVADADSHVDALINHNDGSGPLFKLHRDPRVTPTGRWLRRTSIDELPQLINVLLGHMSIVGPRPALPREVLQYTPRERERLLVKPGITGLWQVSGRSDLTWEDGVRLDLLYVGHWSLRADLRIIARTLTTLANSHGAY